MLDFESDFRFNGAVSAADQVPSLTGVIPADAGGDGAVAFTTTHWSVVLTAQGQSPVADEALEKLCRLYWWPLYGFVRRRAMLLRKHKILLRGSSRCCWREEIWMRCAGKGSITCLSSRFTQKFPRQGASARDGRQTW